MADIKDGAVYVTIDKPDQQEELLYSFAVNKYELKPEHIKAIDKLAKHLIARMKANPAAKWYGTIVGYATKTGSEDNNKALSHSRAEAVRAALMKSLGEFASRVTLPTSGLGSSSTTVKGEDPLGRSASILLSTTPSVSVPKDLPSVLKQSGYLGYPKSGAFKIKVLQAYSVSLPTWVPGTAISAIKLDLVLWDIKNNLLADYTYVGAESDLTIPSSAPPVAYTQAGNWTGIMTSKEVQIIDFGGKAALQEGSAFEDSFALLAMHGLPDGAHTIPFPVPLTTGTTYGVPSTGLGPSVMLRQGAPYKYGETGSAGKGA